MGDPVEGKGGPQPRGGKKKDADDEKNAWEEGDFIDEKIHLKLSRGSTCTSSATSSAPSSTSSTRARRNWSVFSERLRETLSRVGGGGPSSTTDSLILFDVKRVGDCMWICERAASPPSSFDSSSSDSDDDSFLRIFKFFPPTPAVSLDTLASGFDNTGNVRIWPGSEALAWTILRDPNKILGPSLGDGDGGGHRRILELGAGFLGLSSILIACKVPDSSVWVTDGNMESVRSLEKIRNSNSSLDRCCHVRQLIWGAQELQQQHTFDTILAADCVFFSEHHESLMKCIHSHLRPSGRAILSSPRRKQSLQKFLDYVGTVWSDEFTVCIEPDLNLALEQKIGRIWMDGEEKDEKFPILVILQKI